MDSSVILSDFLVAQSGLEDIVSLGQFSRLFKKAPPQVVEKLYRELVRQRRQNIAQISSEIKTFDAPVDVNVVQDLPVELQGKFSMAGLLKQLHQLQLKLQAQCGAVDGKIEDMFLDLQIHIDELSALEYSNDQAGLGRAVDEAMEKVEECEKFIERNKEKRVGLQ